MHWADSIGARHICTMLSEWEMKYGQFFKPCSHLLERAAGDLPLVRTMSGHTVVWFFRYPNSIFFARFVHVF